MADILVDSANYLSVSKSYLVVSQFFSIFDKTIYMAFLEKEDFEKALKEHYDSLTKQDFGILMNATKDKIKQLLDSGDIVIEKNEEIDDYEITYVSNNFYEVAFNAWQFVARTKKLSFKQYKCLSAFTKFKPKSTETEFKQF